MVILVSEVNLLDMVQWVKERMRFVMWWVGDSFMYQDEVQSITPGS